MERPKAGGVVFAKDYMNLTRFYVETIGLRQLSQDDSHTVLGCEGFRLVVHQIPPHVASGVNIDNPPRRREHGTTKLCYAVDSLERVRRTAAALGGTLDPPETEWSDSESTSCKGHDPEGNVFNVFVYRRD